MSKFENELRIVFLSDTHLGFDFPLRKHFAQNRRGSAFFDNYQQALNYAFDNDADCLIHGGDFFFRSKVSSKIVNKAYLPLFELAQSGIKCFMVPGNHERSCLPFSLFLNHPNIFIFKKPKTFKINLGNHLLSISGFPFMQGNIREHFSSVLKQTLWDSGTSSLNILCLHQLIEGAHVGPINYIFKEGEDVIRMQDIPESFFLVLAGHIHTKQVLSKPSKKGDIPIVYAGSVEKTSFAERNEEKGFFDIRIGKANSGKWKIKDLLFICLPSVSMYDLYLDKWVIKNDLLPFLFRELEKLKPNSIVRLKWEDEVSKMTRSYVYKQVREIFPANIKIKYTINF